MRLKNIYTSIACNRTTECADWGNNNLIVYGACNAVAIFDPRFDGNSAKILHTYVKHTKRVNTVQWLRETRTSQESYFLSGADDGLAVLWCVTDPEAPVCFSLQGHESGVNAVSGVKCTHEQEWCLATASADSTIKLWHFDGSTCSCFQTVLLNSGFCFALRLTLLPKTEQLLLAYSSDDESVSLWARPSTDAQQQLFQRVHKLVGHEDWVRGLDFVEDGEDLLLASCSQDNFIRLWRIAPRTAEQVRDNAVDIFNLLDEANGEIRVEEKILQLGENVWFAISLESVLYGHEGWVYGVHWQKSEQQGLRLLSASIDKTLIIWEPSEEEGGVWLEKVRVGEVGGNSLGFFGGKFASDGKSILGHSYQGGFHIWNQTADDECNWTPSVVVGGHFGEVRDFAWEPQGAYLMSVSADQTTRLHAPWLRTQGQQEVTWHELARPQVHGYDMQALAVLSRYRFASGAEEKIVRTFQASANFVENFRHLAGVTDSDTDIEAQLKTLPKGASVPSLGLSNKAVYKLETPTHAEKHVKDEYPENYFVPITLETPPQEETLMQNTLWPEVQKLYAHGFEIYALASTSDGKLLASSCRATNAEHAQIILWNTTNWQQVQKLPSHQLTVTQMRFSPNGRYLLSVSRDRRWSLFEQQIDTSTNTTTSSFKLTAFTDKTNGVHARIIWTCDWSHDSKYFATGSRDGKVAFWTQKPTSDQNSLHDWHALKVLELKNASITAIAFAASPLSVDQAVTDAYLLALGFETGIISLYRFDAHCTLLLNLDHNQSHHLTVKRLQFRPSTETKTKQFQLASCGDDHIVRIYEINT